MSLVVTRDGHGRALQLELGGKIWRPGATLYAYRGLRDFAQVALGRQPTDTELDRLQAELEQGIQNCA